MTKLGGKLKQYLFNNIYAFDQTLNALLGGDPDETLSSRMGKRPKEHCQLCWLICRGLHLIDPMHCEKAVEKDRGNRNVIK